MAMIPIFDADSWVLTPQVLVLYTYICVCVCACMCVCVYTYLLLLISMLWHRQVIFESKWDKLSSSAECRIRTQRVSELSQHYAYGFLVSNSARPSADTVLRIKSNRSSFKFLRVPWFSLTCVDEIISFKIADKIYQYFNSLWPSDAIWGHGSGSTLAQVMAWCRQATSHYLSQC